MQQTKLCQRPCALTGLVSNLSCSTVAFNRGASPKADGKAPCALDCSVLGSFRAVPYCGTRLHPYQGCRNDSCLDFFRRAYIDSTGDPQGRLPDPGTVEDRDSRTGEPCDWSVCILRRHVDESHHAAATGSLLVLSPERLGCAMYTTACRHRSRQLGRTFRAQLPPAQH